MEIPRSLLARTDLTLGERITLVALYLRANKSRSYVWPKNCVLEADTGQHQRSIQKQLSSLESHGLLKRGDNEHGRREITLTLPTAGGPPPLAHRPPPTHDGPPPHGPAATPPRPTGHPLHSRNLQLNHPINQSTEAPSSHPPTPTQLDLDGQDDPQRITERSQPLAPLWARHEVLRNEAKRSLGKRTRTNKLSLTVRKMLAALLKAGHEEDELIAAWSQARNEAITKQDMRWFNGVTELRPENVVRLAGQYHGETVDDAREARRHIIGGNKGWGVANVCETDTLPTAAQAKQDEWDRRKQAASDEWDRLRFEQAKSILEPYGICDWMDYMHKMDLVPEAQQKEIYDLPDPQCPEPESSHYD